MNKVVQCVPNFSEGQKEDVIRKIVSVFQEDGYIVASVEPDKDYNRTVVTLLGDAERMMDDLVKMVHQAKKFIDLNHQQGQHPRMGAVDVIPFIPIHNTTMDECIDYANRLGKRISEEEDIPVFLYAKAASSPSRRKLPRIRKGEFEGMKEKITLDKWAPDFGTPAIHPTFGVVAIGARDPLIAYNIDLDTEDMEVAKKISRAIRFSSGGFRFIQAGPAYLEKRSHVQVTMNILDYKKNPIYRIYETVKMEAKQYGVTVTSAELVGMCPKDTLIRSIKYYLKRSNITIPNNFSIEDVVKYTKKYLEFRDFDQSKIIESLV